MYDKYEAVLFLEKMPQNCNECEFFIRNEDGYPVCFITKEEQGYLYESHERKMNSCPLEYMEDQFFCSGCGGCNDNY